MATRTIRVENLARVEGEGAVYARLRDGVVEHVELNIFEPPRFFEALLVGRDFREAPDITARICGICPVAYQMSAVHAMEAACGVVVDDRIRALRRLLYCGEWIESHVLHVAMLHAPDFLGYSGAIEMAQEHGDIVRAALRMKKAGNAIVAAIGGREVHPINVRVGGFFRAPTPASLAALVDELQWSRDACLGLLRWAATLPYPDFERPYCFVALRHDTDYPMNEGRIVSSDGLDIAAAEFHDVFEEFHAPHANALHARKRGGGEYLVGPLARYALNADRLPAHIRAAAAEAGLHGICRNPYRSLLIRCVETLYAFEEALRLIRDYDPPEPSFVEVAPVAATGAWATEAPRGLLHHRYVIAADGAIQHATIVPPTSQNQPSIEADLRGVLTQAASLDDDALKLRCEQTIRNYDPCISCATHFLKLTVERITSEGR